ncbi:hypothetical protein LSAT2_019257 [Lamellibrachia satsuma]|nr:hypothetical protein LSAT2_019257 [Lamellibrachia satsuma]
MQRQLLPYSTPRRVSSAFVTRREAVGASKCDPGRKQHKMSCRGSDPTEQSRKRAANLVNFRERVQQVNKYWDICKEEAEHNYNGLLPLFNLSAIVVHETPPQGDVRRTG